MVSSKLTHITVKVMRHGAFFLSACCFCISFLCNVHSQPHQVASPSENTSSVSTVTDSPSVFNVQHVLSVTPLAPPQGTRVRRPKRVPSSQDSNSLSLLTEMSGVEAPVPLRSVSVLQSLASGLPRWRGEVGNKWG